MRTRTLRLILLLAVATVAAPASATDVNARVGVGYSRFEYAPTLGDHTTTPRLDIDLGLDAKGFFQRSGFLDWIAGASYRRVSEEVNGATSGQSDVILYNGRLTLLGDRTAPVTLQAAASRNEVKFLTDPQADIFGRGIVNSYGGSLTLNLPERPSLSAGYTRNDAEDQIAGLTTHRYNVDEFTGTVGHGSPDFKFIGTYQGRLSSGDWVSDNVDTHQGNASVIFGLPAGMTGQLVDVYQLRIPRATGLGAYRQENNSFGAYVSNSQPLGGQQTVRYSYLHGLTETSPVAFNELTRQSIRYDGDFRLGGEPLEKKGRTPEEGSRYFAHVRVEGAQNRANTATVTSDAYGETLAALGYWRYIAGDKYYDLHGGPAVGLIQSDLTGNRSGYGFSAGGRFGREWLGQRFNVNYDTDYGLRLYASEGWSLRQILSGTVSGMIGTSRYMGQVNAQSFRTSSPTFGDGAGRSVDVRFVNTHRRLELEILGRLADGIAGSTPREFVSDGLLIPAPFDSHTRELRARIFYRAFTTLTLGATGAFISNEIPGSPTVTQTEVSGVVDYRFAAFGLHLEDRMTWYDQGGGGRNNLFLVSVSRRFGVRF